MQLKSILNRVQKHPSFVYETVRLVEYPRLSIEVRVRPRAGARARCSQCRRRAPGAVLQWRCRRLQREGQSDHQTGVWVPHLRGTGSRFVSRTWRPARTRTHPQILLTRRISSARSSTCTGWDRTAG